MYNSTLGNTYPDKIRNALNNLRFRFRSRTDKDRRGFVKPNTGSDLDLLMTDRMRNEATESSCPPTTGAETPGKGMQVISCSRHTDGLNAADCRYIRGVNAAA